MPSLRCSRRTALATSLAILTSPRRSHAAIDREVTEAMRRAATYYSKQVAVHGGYVYHSTLDLKTRWGEGKATASQIWVQPPGTPTVGEAYLDALNATNDPLYEQAAIAAGEALVYGQLESGGWANLVDFDPQSKNAGRYRNGKGKGRNHSTLDDGITQSALKFLLRLDAALSQKNAAIHQTTDRALEALLQAQFPNGAFPQVWEQPVAPQPIVAAKYPDYDWRTENRIKEYWDLYTLNDDSLLFVTETLLEAIRLRHDPRCETALRRLGDFLVLAQMPDPQPVWAQQYDFAMRPVWARKFEPPAIAGRESQSTILCLLKIFQHTADERYLAPIPKALAFLERSLLPDGQLARYYELRTNRPLYMNSRYELTYATDDLPDHYGWQHPNQLDLLKRTYEAMKRDRRTEWEPMKAMESVDTILKALDQEGRWISTYAGERLVGQPKFAPGDRYLSSALFAERLNTLARYLTPAGANSGASR